MRIPAAIGLVLGISVGAVGCGTAPVAHAPVRPPLKLPVLGSGSNPAVFAGRQHLNHWETLAADYPRSEGAQLAAGIAAFQNNQPQVAIRYYERARHLAPHDGAPDNNIGNVYRVAHNYRLAVQWYQKAVKIDPLEANAWYNLSWTQNQMGNQQAAQTDAREALKVLPATSPLVQALKVFAK